MAIGLPILWVSNIVVPDSSHLGVAGQDYYTNGCLYADAVQVQKSSFVWGCFTQVLGSRPSGSSFCSPADKEDERSWQVAFCTALVGLLWKRAESIVTQASSEIEASSEGSRQHMLQVCSQLH